jgi:hypothetical protein
MGSSFEINVVNITADTQSAPRLDSFSHEENALVVPEETVWYNIE